jgi:hypothetical protein
MSFNTILVAAGIFGMFAVAVFLFLANMQQPPEA